MCRIGEHPCRFSRDPQSVHVRPKDQEEINNDDAEPANTTTYCPFEELYRINFERREGRTIFLSRHGESEYNVDARIGGNPPLTPKGQRYAKALGTYMNSLNIPNLKVITSSLRRTHMTAAHVEADKASTSMLDELNSGFLDGYTYSDVKMLFPEEYERRKKDKLRYRYPGGESYLDCCGRIVHTLKFIELHLDETYLIVAHQGLLRCLLGYLLRIDLDKIPFIIVPQHAVIKLVWSNGKYNIEYLYFDVEDRSQ